MRKQPLHKSILFAIIFLLTCCVFLIFVMGGEGILGWLILFLTVTWPLIVLYFISKYYSKKQPSEIDEATKKKIDRGLSFASLAAALYPILIFLLLPSSEGWIFVAAIFGFPFVAVGLVIVYFIGYSSLAVGKVSRTEGKKVKNQVKENGSKTEKEFIGIWALGLVGTILSLIMSISGSIFYLTRDSSAYGILADLPFLAVFISLIILFLFMSIRKYSNLTKNKLIIILVLAIINLFTAGFWSILIIISVSIMLKRISEKRYGKTNRRKKA